MNCKTCESTETFFTSDQVNVDKAGRRPFEINIRSFIAFREVGIGHSGMEKFNRCMNFPPAMNNNAYDNIKHDVHDAYHAAVQERMREAANEIIMKNTNNNIQTMDGIYNCMVSFDGTWQKRGYSSRNGIVTAISVVTGKCLDFDICVKDCKGCEV